jgi:anti-sigma regulatory factor (Ser/Thr protein kinase)
VKRRYDEVLADEMSRLVRADAVPELVEFVALHASEFGLTEGRIKEISDAVREALQNIVCFTCSRDDDKISITCGVHDAGGMLITITDTGAPFNIFLAAAFPEMEGLADPDRKPSTTLMKKAAQDIEYKRSDGRNILIFNIPKAA